ncbi:hypothetical protein [Chryseobacterium oncorhynchi]|uniref:Lipoprotein n=1 Tax=Chryseobacterium oncorhynchi TaxID=741074 RepID=A0A316WJ73_9FLAO|nr:hypothetical protein [Chryseobacterium oncorhynchi]PWN59218.1 hypothetical protein C1638_021665 [Chryseobacterium oncorhynchi]
MKNFIIILSVLVIFLIGCLYLRTGYFESSIQKDESTFYTKDGDSITSKRYYRDLSGNWILLDKKVIITDGSWKAISVKAD